MKLNFYTPFILFLILLTSVNVCATHIRAGEIITERVDAVSKKYKITVYLYRDVASSATTEAIDLNLGDGTTQRIFRTTGPTFVGNATEVSTYVTFHTYPSNGSYRIWFVEENRNEGVVNMNNSVNTPFSIESFITINSFVGVNRSPQLTVPPLDLACGNQKFIHNPGAFDLDGDSLAFKLVTPWKDFGVNVDGYRDPESFGGKQENSTAPSLFKIDPITGSLEWNSPPQSALGEYNVAFVVEEWKNGVLVGYVVRDMQIIVVDCQNKRPNIKPIPDLCVEAGQIVNQEVTATDPDGDPIKLSAPQLEFDPKGGVFASPFNATFSRLSTDPAQASPASATFNWVTKCEFIREEPYIVVFKAEDVVSPPKKKLSDIKSFLIRVVGPSPQNLNVTPNGRTMVLTWDPYVCANAEKIVICRKVGCGNPDPTNCNLGCPEGYKEVAQVPANATTYTDKTVFRGPIYSYRIHAIFPQKKGGGSSYVSKESCAELPIDAPVITNVSVEKTDMSNGEIYIRWLIPIDLNLTTFPLPHKFRVFRAEGIEGTAFTQIHELTTTTNTQKLLTYTDTGLDTKTKAYNYRIVLDYGTGFAFKDSSDVASSVSLDAKSAPCSIDMSWKYRVPWSNDNQKHKVFKQNQSTTFDLIKEVFVGISRFIDLGEIEKLITDNEYCYYAETRGTFANPRVPVEPVLNKSQIDCNKPIDLTAPNPPILAIDTTQCISVDKLDCDTDGCLPLPYQNKLSWIKGAKGDCEDNIKFYRLYYRPTNTGDFNLIKDNISAQNFTHINPNKVGDIVSQAGCYVVTAVDFAGNESQYSNIVCQDNCTYYKLPNILTPNKDGKNDILRPCPSPCFVEKVHFKLYDRYGVLVHEQDDDIFINWEPPKNIVSGAYFYAAEVSFVTLNPDDKKQTIKGWITILREAK